MFPTKLSMKTSSGVSFLYIHHDLFSNLQHFSVSPGVEISGVLAGPTGYSLLKPSYATPAYKFLPNLNSEYLVTAPEGLNQKLSVKLRPFT